jgi:hypothetical protein
MSAFKNPKRLSRCVHFSGVNTSLVPAFLWCQHFSGARAFWCPHFLVPEHLWCQHFSGTSTFLVSALFWCQHRPPGPFDRRLWAKSSGFVEAEVKRVAPREAKRRPERRSRSGQGRGGKATWWMLTIACNQRCISNVGKDVGCDKIQTEGTASWNWFRRPFHPDRQAHPIARTEISRRHILADSTIDETVQRGNFMHTCNRMQICLVQSDKEPVHLVLSRVGRDADPNSTPKSRIFQYCAGNLE